MTPSLTFNRCIFLFTSKSRLESLRQVHLQLVVNEEDTGGVLVGGRVKSDETLGNGVVVRSLYSVLGNVARVVELG